ncbi:FtsX-like permease family protein [Kitasatospora mediocidica]|uniref:FtsX-like permease family protein n=1 Tax=Kitasatospora mediocidica TaxID=58352 RepID=UPI00055ADD4B|nr:FtsX-like permease family protein [Kitasatospora mediocidica]
MNPLKPSARTAAPWVRTRLRTSRAAALLLAVLVLGTAFLAAALPRTLDRDADRAVDGLLSNAGPLPRSLVGRTTMPHAGDPDPGRLRAYYNDARLTAGAQAIRADLSAPLRPAPASADAVGGRTTGARSLTDAALPRPGGIAPELSLAYLQGQADQVHLIAGTLPTDPPTVNAYGYSTRYQIALSKETADRFGVTVGADLSTASQSPSMDVGAPIVHAVVVGIFQPTDAASDFWSATACLTGPCLRMKSHPPDLPSPYWTATALVGASELPLLTFWQGDAELFWQISADPHSLPAHRLGQAQSVVSSALDGARADALPQQSGVPELRLTSMLPGLLTQAQQEQSAAAALYAIGPLGAGAVALVVLLLAAGLAADRRRAELSLARARGGSLRGIGARLLGESAVAVLPAAVAGTALALRLLPTQRWTAAVLAGGAVGLLALLAFPLRAVGLLWAGRLRRGAGGGARPGRSGRSRLRLGDPRRVIAETVVLVVATAAVLAVRRRGAAAPGTSLDLLLSAAPLLLALVGALVLARLFPLLLAPAARWARRRPGAIGFIGLARIARGSGGGRRTPTVLPLLALLLAVTTAGFGVTVLASADAGRIAGVRQLVGGDAQVNAVRPDGLPSGFAAAAAALPGVRGGTAAVVDLIAPVGPSAGVTMVIIDPTSYAALAQHIGIGRFDPAVFSDAGSAPGDPVAALASPSLAARLGDGLNFAELPVPYGRLSLKVVGTVDGTPALPDGGGGQPILLISGPAVVRQLPNAKPLWDNPTTWFGTGDGLEAGPLRALLGKLDAGRPAPATDPTAAGPAGGTAPAGTPGTPSADKAFADSSYSILTRASYARLLSADPLERAATRLFWGSVGGAAGFTVLSLLLTLLRAAPERAALLARLRTMGLRPRQGLALILIEALPQALIAALAGAAIAFLTVPLLGGSIDLSAMEGTTVAGALHPAVLPVLQQAAGLAALAVLVVCVETAISGRRQINTELRAGEHQ